MIWVPILVLVLAILGGHAMFSGWDEEDEDDRA